uniref:Cystatin domain-containing protein n=1 Tax=Rhabditophanes sp. KR3021 TaxID=114890 RepID=A0AC35UEZ7_9BILA
MIHCQMMIAGNFSPCEKSYPEFKENLDYVIREWNQKNSKDIKWFKLKKINSALCQSVAGVNYIFTLILGRTTCPKQQILAHPNQSSCKMLLKTVRIKYRVNTNLKGKQIRSFLMNQCKQ